MKNDDMELVRGSGNVYRDFGYPDADVRQLKSILAAQILKILERDKLSVREAQRRTGIAAADFSRVRQVKLERFTIDRLLTIVNKLGMRVDFKITARRERHPESVAA
jgi:predicted XRE-type DNA-binding protein